MSDLPAPLKPHLTVQDSVHGRIWLTQLEHKLINTAEFQRLRHISQLGLANFVFPTASHSRLAHSLGATHVMGWMLRQPSMQRHFADRPKHIVLLRLAALLHDIGHYPFSHLGEFVYGAVEYGGLAEYGPGKDTTVFDVAARARFHDHASHERQTAELIRNTRIADEINRAVGEVDGRAAVDVLVEIIEGTYTADAVCHSLISSDLDCDRLDYLVRDSAAAGLSYGEVDLAYLIENLVIENHSRYGPMLAADLEHGFGAVEHYLHARYFHYARFITHKTIAAAELLLAVGMLELIRTGELPRNAAEVRDMIADGKFLDFTDARIWTLLQAARDSSNKELAETANSLLNRTLMKCAVNLEALETEGESEYEAVRLEALVGTIPRKLNTASMAGVDPASFCYKRNVTRLSGVPARITPKPGDEERFEWIQTVNVARPGGEPEPAVLHGLLRGLSTKRWITRRVFVREPAFTAARKSRKSRPTTWTLEEYFATELARP